MPVIPVTLYQVSTTSTSSKPNQRAFPSTNQSATNSTDASSDQGPFSAAMMNPMVLASRVTPLSVGIQTAKRSEYKQQHEQHGPCALVLLKPNHFVPPWSVSF